MRWLSIWPSPVARLFNGLLEGHGSCDLSLPSYHMAPDMHDTDTPRIATAALALNRRLRWWLLLVSGVLVILAAQAMLPQWWVLPGAADSGAGAALVFVFLAALACEFVDSSLGMGYGTTLTPLLLLAGYAPLDIVPAVLLSELVTGFAAALMHHRDGNVDWIGDARARRTLIQLSALSAVGATVAAVVALQIPTAWLSFAIAAIILAMGVLIVATARRRIAYRPANVVAVGAVAAFNKGLSGGGYGPLVTAGQVISGLPAKHAIAVTSFAEAFTCLVGLAAYVALGRGVDWTLALPLALGALLSVPIATATVRRLPERHMRLFVGLATCALGMVALAKLV